VFIGVPQAVGSGAIEAGVASLTRFAGTNPEVDIFYLPFLFDSEKKIRKATKSGSEIRQILDPAISKSGAVPLYYQAYGSAVMLSNGTPMNTPAAFKNKKIRNKVKKFFSDFFTNRKEDFEIRSIEFDESIKNEVKQYCSNMFYIA